MEQLKMTERFYISGVGISDRERKRLYDLQTVDGFISVRDLLNELSTENRQLKQENEQLKESVWSWSKSYNRVYEDKERILNTIKHAYYNERTQLGKSVLKQLLEQLQ